MDFELWILPATITMVSSIRKDEFITLKEAASELNVTKYTLRELLYREKDLIEAFTIGDELYMRKNEFLKAKSKILELLKLIEGKK